MARGAICSICCVLAPMLDADLGVSGRPGLKLHRVPTFYANGARGSAEATVSLLLQAFLSQPRFLMILLSVH